ncbi:hypothetical protein EK599_17995 [Vibrio sp. T187]|uniref:capsule assembly Wzi family protein n=1 Tax=Vibrio TaxID=662 RepID=UPI0010C9FEA0|nr:MULTISPECIES: capsule assembly Wzi family protein [Vibrio]MBW3697578.1 hypothetical protein [Vibrio sp. T187]
MNAMCVHTSRSSLASISLIILVPFSVEASPWLEANDPFLRSSLVLLSDSNIISSPVNHYPLRWSAFGDDLSDPLLYSRSINTAINELSYTLYSAKFNRGNRGVGFVFSTEQPVYSGFGQFNKDEWASYASYEYLDNDYSFRLTTGYSKFHQETDIRWENSYLSLNLGAWLFSIGTLDRWWGQGWQHNLTLASYAKAAPDISASFIGENNWLGVWGVEVIVAKPQDSIFEYHNATRLTSKPLENVEFGFAYQRWFDERKLSQGDELFSSDAKLVLPSIGMSSSNLLYHNIYTELASSVNEFCLNSWIVGWTGSFDMSWNTVRVVIETQQSDNKSIDLSNQYSSGYQSGMENTLLLEESYSVATYIQLKNDHSISVSVQQSKMYAQEDTLVQATYRQPALSGMVHVGASYLNSVDDNMKGENQMNFWSGYEFRF